MFIEADGARQSLPLFFDIQRISSDFNAVRSSIPGPASAPRAFVIIFDNVYRGKWSAAVPAAF